MAMCFPTAKYIFFFISFVFAFILANRANQTEVLGLGLLFSINYLYTLFIGSDISSYVQTHSQIWSGITGLNLTSIIVGLAFNFISSILVIMAMVRYYLNNKTVNPQVFGRLQFDQMKRYMMSTIILIGVIATQLYFSPGKLTYEVIRFINELVAPTTAMYWAQFAFGAIAFGVFCSLMWILNYQLQADDRLNTFRGYFHNLSIALGVLLVVSVLKAVGNSYYNNLKLDAFLELSTWVFMVMAFVYWIYSVAEFDHLGKPYYNQSHKKEDDAKQHQYYNRYHKYNLRSTFVSFMFFVMLLLLAGLTKLTYFIELVFFVIKIFAPMALLGLSSYTVYLADRISKKSSHLLLEQKRITKAKRTKQTTDTAGNG